jgi:ankyrin repeat protein
MMRRLARLGSGVGLVVACSAWLQAAAAAPVAEAVMQGDVTALRRQLAAGADVNAAQGDGMTALHWAATKGRADLATMLLAAGARPAATTRLGGFTPLHLAARAGSAAIVDALVTAGADVTATTSTGTTALMLAAESGVVTAVERLVRAGAAVNAVESAKGQSALMFAAAYDRADVVAFLLANGADPTLSTTVHDLAKLTDPGQDRAPGGRAAPRQVQVPGLSRQFRYNELIGTQGGLTALLFATREGYTGSALALLAGGADVNQVNPGDRTSPLLMAVVNGHFDRRCATSMRAPTCRWPLPTASRRSMRR